MNSSLITPNTRKLIQVNFKFAFLYILMNQINLLTIFFFRLIQLPDNMRASSNSIDQRDTDSHRSIRERIFKYILS